MGFRRSHVRSVSFRLTLCSSEHLSRLRYNGAEPEACAPRVPGEVSIEVFSAFSRFGRAPLLFAGIAQLVERHVANVIVAGSSPATRSTYDDADEVHMVERLFRKQDESSSSLLFGSTSG